MNCMHYVATLHLELKHPKRTVIHIDDWVTGSYV